MARIRSIKPEFWTSEQVMECSLNTRLLFIGMWNFADDLGRLSLSPKSIKSKIFPSDEISSENILGMIQELSTNGLVLIYTVDDKDYLQITGWQHQRIDKPQPGKHPSPVNGYSKNVRGVVATDRIGGEGNGEDRNSEAKASGATAPRDVRAELFSRGLQTLSRLTGKGPDSCRSFVGKCLKAASDDAIIVLGLIEDAERNQVADASAWISARLKSTGPPAKPLTEFQRKQQETNDVRAELRNFGSGSRGSGALDRFLPDYHRERSEGLRGGAGQTVLALPRASSR